MAKTVSGKVKKTPPSQVSSERYDFIELAETEPDLGVPESSGYLLGSNTDGTRQWVNLTARVSYEHIQGVSSDTWVITHNLGFKPNVTVVDSAGTIYEGEITYTNTNSLTVTFSSAFSGKAFLS
jgi:hypothetical protein